MQIILSIGLAVLFSLSASAFPVGNGSSGGGRGVVCRDANGTIKTAELLDIWEARTISRRTIPESTAAVWDQVESALQLLKEAPYVPYFSLHPTEPRTPADDIQLMILRNRASHLKPDSKSLVPLRGVTLNDTPDSYEPAVPVGCKIEQVVDYQDAPEEPQILVNQDIVDKMSPTSQAALIVHEALYAELREQGESTSIRVRRAVGYVFSGGTFPSMETNIYGKSYVVCNGGSRDTSVSTIYIYKQNDGTLGISGTEYWNEYSLGVYPAEAYTNSVLAELFKGDLANVVSGDVACSTQPTWDFPKESVSLQGHGPVDFQRQAYLEIACPNHKLEMSLVDGASKNRQVLRCLLLDDTKPFPFPKP